MALTTAGKRLWSDEFVSAERFIALGIGNTELVGHGYTRGSWPVAAMSIRNSDARVSNSADLDVYTANDDSAQDATHIAMFDAATGGNQLTEWETFPDINAPINGQAVRILSGQITLTP